MKAAADSWNAGRASRRTLVYRRQFWKLRFADTGQGNIGEAMVCRRQERPGREELCRCGLRHRKDEDSQMLGLGVRKDAGSGLDGDWCWRCVRMGCRQAVGVLRQKKLVVGWCGRGKLMDVAGGLGASRSGTAPLWGCRQSRRAGAGRLFFLWKLLVELFCSTAAIMLEDRSSKLASGALGSRCWFAVMGNCFLCVMIAAGAFVSAADEESLYRCWEVTAMEVGGMRGAGELARIRERRLSSFVVKTAPARLIPPREGHLRSPVSSYRGLQPLSKAPISRSKTIIAGEDYYGYQR
ncbi:hypothetical protein MLD38_034466 [Melastoma candidum]|uniref:Uncharacterized protein n=1 Tax=Melastoma candidum TaxID=119954 RepID=A0ACB9M9S5_9MYRT|nr:hypothetical protein MLD38_034466 [Melastoma candidum]